MQVAARGLLLALGVLLAPPVLPWGWREPRWFVSSNPRRPLLQKSPKRPLSLSSPVGSRPST